MPEQFPENPYSPDYIEASTLTTSVNWQHGNALPADVKINVVASHQSLGSYDSFKIDLFGNVNNTAIYPIDITDGNNIISEFVSAGGYFNKNAFIKFKDLGLLDAGSYPVEIFFTYYGINNGMAVYLTEAAVFFTLNVQGVPDSITTDKDEYTLIFNRQNNSLTGDLNININGNVNDSPLRFFNYLEIFKNVDPILNNSVVLEEKTPLISNSNLPLEGEYEISSAIFKKIVGGPYVNVKSFLINLIVVNGDMMITPKNLNFSLIQTAGEVKEEVLKIINPYNKDFTIEGPYWLEFSIDSGSQSEEVTISTLNSSNLPIGDISDNILIKYEDKTISIPVSLSVISFIFLSGMETYNFCLDNKIINFIKRELTARYVKSTLSIKFQSEDETVSMVVPLTVPYYNERASFDLGGKIHQYFLRLKKSILKEEKKPGKFDNKLWMYPAEVKILVEELDVDYNVVHAENVAAIFFYPGKKPAAFPLLSNNLIKQRVAGSKYIFTYIQGLILPNKIGIGTPNVLPDGLVTRVKIEDDEEKIIFPRKKIFQITDDKQVVYYTIPNNGPQVINLQYENQNLCPESFSFTGHLKKTPEYSHVYDQNVLSSIKEKYDVTKITTWTINTGFILEKCTQIIDEIIMSKLCYVEIDNVIHRGFVVSQKIVAADTSLELIQFDLDFILLQ
ncbi:hypothetical protein EG346_16015 [Chryseobacterium carnipullorum]|uniref:Uncharacterized protein n=1 Tax=Chryseobacterium carnipullorum TaxID=1124835 RepID=A0A376DST3_CHRCU|nr:hypothetical protein [Chryseobacterium carnipullorum]AZA49592.1 hypothetical protein EG346_16015 [Chryseobacterium carnipullorum]AZA64488.1 hypothetical protein EG345_07030 [Chryseobacterium carnipullorum]STC94916.1 Uncharacterised protein [Chryseobacterium carnipullorum]